MTRTENSGPGVRRDSFLRTDACYIDAIMLKACTIIVVRPSVMPVRNSGQYPMEVSTTVTSADGMIIPAKGTAIRLVSRKYCGRLPK